METPLINNMSNGIAHSFWTVLTIPISLTDRRHMLALLVFVLCFQQKYMKDKKKKKKKEKKKKKIHFFFGRCLLKSISNLEIILRKLNFQI